MRDLDVRQALHSKVLKAHRNEPDTLVVDELGLCQGVSRVDVAVVNGQIHGYEIKSEKDTLDRLPEQVRIYGGVLDKVTLVAAEKHVDRARGIVPPWWGITVAVQGKRGAIRFSVHQRSRANPAVDLYAVAQLLWRDEALALLERLGLARGLKSKPRQHLWRVLADSVPGPDLKREVRQQLKAREGWRQPPPDGG